MVIDDGGDGGAKKFSSDFYRNRYAQKMTQSAHALLLPPSGMAFSSYACLRLRSAVVMLSSSWEPSM